MRFSALLVLSAIVAIVIQQVFDSNKQEPKKLSVCQKEKFCRDFMATIDYKLNFN